jgi:hypothetical protein
VGPGAISDLANYTALFARRVSGPRTFTRIVPGRLVWVLAAGGSPATSKSRTLQSGSRQGARYAAIVQADTVSDDSPDQRPSWVGTRPRRARSSPTLLGLVGSTSTPILAPGTICGT